MGGTGINTRARGTMGTVARAGLPKQCGRVLVWVDLHWSALKEPTTRPKELKGPVKDPIDPPRPAARRPPPHRNDDDIRAFSFLVSSTMQQAPPLTPASEWCAPSIGHVTARSTVNPDPRDSSDELAHSGITQRGCILVINSSCLYYRSPNERHTMSPTHPRTGHPTDLSSYHYPAAPPAAPTTPSGTHVADPTGDFAAWLTIDGHLCRAYEGTSVTNPRGQGKTVVKCLMGVELGKVRPRVIVVVKGY